jgi:hypothetical protein
MNPSRAPKSEKPKKSRTRPHERRTFSPGVDRLEQRISLSGLSPVGNSGQFIAYGSLNHNETVVRARRTARKRDGASRKGRRPLAPAVEGLERRVSLSGFGLTGSITHAAGHLHSAGMAVNHNETLVRARPVRRRNGAGRKDRRPLAPAVEGLERRISLSGVGLTASVTHAAGLVQQCGIMVNHNETLVRAPRRRGR